MNIVTIVLRPGLNLNFEAMRPALQVGAPIAIGRGGSVIAEVAEGNAIEDKRQAAEAAAGYIDSVERYVESASTLEGVVTVLESTLQSIEQYAETGKTEPWEALRRIRELAAAFLDNSGARAQRASPASGAAAEPAYPGAAAARRPVNPGEHPHPTPEITGERCPLCQANNHSETECAWHGNEKALALVQQIDKHIAERAAEFNAAPAEALKPGIFDVITGTACVTGDGSGAQLPPLEEHLAQVEQVAAGVREDQADLAESILVLQGWLERVEVENGYVSVPVIEAVEVVVTELKRQQQAIHPVACRYDHWFAGDSEEASFIREHGVCRACAEVDSMLCESPAEWGEA